ncbi:MAG: GFA family protein [Rhodospirillaceae bacterium]
MTGFTGGCLCGAVRYEVTGEPTNMWNCHCDACRKITGASYATNVFVKEEDLKITKGRTKTYKDKADSGNDMTRHFCGDCGSPLFNENSGRPGIRVIRAGTIDDPSFVKPWANLYAKRALQNTHLGGDMTNFDAMPDR